MIRHVRHSDIDKAAWDRDLLRCSNALWYGTSAVLDAAAEVWDALIDAESGARLVLPRRRKFGITYAYQPFLIQQLGPFAPSADPEAPTRFIAALPSVFRYADIALCPGHGTALPAVRFDEFTNVELSLGASLTELRAAYSENHRRNLRKADRSGIGVEHLRMDDLKTFLHGSEQFKRWGIDGRQLRVMDRVFAVAERMDVAVVRGVRHQGRVVAGGLFIRWGGRLIFLKGLSSAAGREVGAMQALIDGVIAEHAGHALVLDFAGSNDPDLARFYLGFGGERSVYLRALVNRLPPLLRLIKK
ncbi:MAG TPA: GNAT family N-acetyltransferase [Flavobacteriales bacterium]